MPKSHRDKLRGLVAINCHQFHAKSKIELSIKSTLQSVALARREKDDVEIEVVFFHPPSHAPMIAHGEITCHTQKFERNGENLNMQIKFAASNGFDILFRVDADDLVSRDRFTRQISLAQETDAILLAGGLIYSNEDTGVQSSVIPKKQPGTLAYLANLYLMHPTLAIRVTPFLATGLTYWPHRLEDKELAAAAFEKGIIPLNDQAIYGTYSVNGMSRSWKGAADLNYALNRRFLKAARRPDLVPLAAGIHAARRIFGAKHLRSLRNRLTSLTRTETPALADVQDLPMKKDQKENPQCSAAQRDTINIS